MQQITINEKAYNVGFSFKGIRNFEELAKKSITECKSTWDNLIYFYATLKALNDDFAIDFDQFCNIMDQHPELMIQFQTASIEQAAPLTDEPVKKKTSSLKTTFGLWTLSLLLLVSPVLLPIISGVAWIGLSMLLLARLIARAGKKLGSLFSHKA